MKPGDYRREYAAYCAALARARYDYRVGRTPDLPLAPLRERDALLPCDDLRAAHLDALNTTANTALGFASYFALLDETTQTDEQKLTAAAGALLARTNDAYRKHLHAWSARHLPPPLARTPVFADRLFFARLASFDQFFAAHDLPRTYIAAMSALGIRVERQTNLRVEWLADAVQPTVQAAQSVAPSARLVNAICFDLDPPADVRLVVGADGGAEAYRAFWQAAGWAQTAAWVSRDMAERYPEFVRGADATTRAAYGFLFRNLLHDPAWLEAQRGLKTSDAETTAQALALVELH